MPNTIDNFARPRDGQCQNLDSLRSIVAIVVEETEFPLLMQLMLKALKVWKAFYSLMCRRKPKLKSFKNMITKLHHLLKMIGCFNASDMVTRLFGSRIKGCWSSATFNCNSISPEQNSI